jgi:sugar phosphate isomerase/epimerase
MRRSANLSAFLLLFTTLFGGAILAAEPPSLFDPANVAAWCIVPFDAKKRSPEERAEMLQRLGLTHFAYDWRDEHIPLFDREIDCMRAKGIAITAWWFPAGLNPAARTILDTLKRHNLKIQLWVTLGTPAGESDIERVKNAAATLAPIADAAAEIGCSVGLYNHGGWFGEPLNQLAILKALSKTNVGLVYNFHHGHGHIANFPALFDAIQPHLYALNINGMMLNGDAQGKKILTVGQGDQEEAMLRHVLQSGWRGPIGILCHRTDIDAEVALRENLAGLQSLRAKLEK